jgi:hypothetical protein
MGEKQNQPFQLSFNTSLRVDFQGSRVTSDGGLLLVRELDARLGLSALSPKTSLTTGAARILSCRSRIDSAGSFGKYSNTLTRPRVMEFALRFSF